MAAATEIPFRWLGDDLAYEPLWRQLRSRADAVAAGTADEIVWSGIHAPVYTTGRRGIDNRTGVQLPAPLVATDRGGETTFHGPGQIMLYPVVDIRRRGLSVRRYVHLLEESCIGLLAGYGITAERRCGLPGVWTVEGKIAAIGLRISRGIAYHGMALNADVALRWFDAIDPCGTGMRAVRLADCLEQLPSHEAIGRAWHRQLAARMPTIV